MREYENGEGIKWGKKAGKQKTINNDNNLHRTLT